jgi:hypothetical protein
VVVVGLIVAVVALDNRVAVEMAAVDVMAVVDMAVETKEYV